MSSRLQELFVNAHTDNLEIKLERMDFLKMVCDKANEAILKRIRLLEYETDSINDRFTELRKYECELKDRKRTQAAKAHNNLYLFVTINPKPSVQLNEFKDAVKKLVGRQLFAAFAYAFEQRATAPEEAGKGFHVHILMRRNLNYKPCKIKSNMCNTMKNICDVKDNRVFNVQWIGEEFARDKLQYITGGKTGDGKDQKQNIDVIFRQNENLEVLYKSEASIF